MQCFEDATAFDKFDREAFKFRHKLMNHPALSLENLARVIPALPKARVMYSMGKLENGDDFETTFRARPKGFSIEETIENIRVSNSYVMVAGPEVDASFAPLHRELIGDVETLMRRQGAGAQIVDPQLYLFIASPGSVTPFHIDRYSTFLMQFRGTPIRVGIEGNDLTVEALPEGFSQPVRIGVRDDVCELIAGERCTFDLGPRVGLA